MTRVRAIQLALGLLALAYATSHVIALFTDGVVWDEYAFLQRARESLATGSLQSGGRPGLAVMPALPFVAGCEDVMSVARGMRLLWSAITFALLGGLFMLLRLATRRTTWSWHTAALGTACLALVPVFLRWSLQVRTDQPAIAAALWAGVAVMASRDRWWLAAVGGALAATGFLCSQKAIYVIALVGVIAVGDLYIERGFAWRRELRRFAAAAGGGAVVLGLYHVLVRMFFVAPTMVSLDAGIDLFTWYRFLLRFRMYRDIVPTVLPHLGLLVLVFFAALHAFRRDTPARRALLVALVIVLLGVAVGRFHTASFPYFWMTIGLFPACAIAIGYAGICELLPRAHVPVTALAWLMLVVLAVKYRAETLDDTQRIQRDTFAFAERMPAELRGYNTDGGLLCRGDPDPLPSFFGVHIARRFSGAEGEAYMAQFLREHRSRPIAFVVRTGRVKFPRPVEEFWDSHYVRYNYSLWLAGQAISGARDTTVELDVLVTGRYRWISRDGSRVVVDGKELAPEQELQLAAGKHAVSIGSSAADGMLVLAIAEPPGPTGPPFYDPLLVRELGGWRRDWW